MSSQCSNCSDCCVCNLVLWKSPVKTGAVFLSSLAAIIFVKNVNLLTLFLRIAYTILFTTGSIEFVSRMFLGPDNGLITRYGVKSCPNTVGAIRPYVDNFLRQMPIQQAKMRMLVFAHAPKNNFKAAAIFYVTYHLVSAFSFLNIVFAAVILAFTLPPIYSLYKKQIDAVVDQLLALLQTYLKQLEKQVDPWFSKVKSPFVSTTKSSTTSKLAEKVEVVADAATGVSSSAAKNLETDNDLKHI